MLNSVLKETDYAEKRENFNKQLKRVAPYKANRPLTSNLELREEYRVELVKTYNELLTSLKAVTDVSLEDKIDIQNRIVGHLAKLKEAFGILKLDYPFEKSIHALIDIENVTENPDNETDSDNENNSDNNKLDNLNDPPNLQDDQSEGSITSTETVITDITMAQTPKDFIATASQMIGYRYDGHPLNLDSFLDAIDLLKEVCEANNLVIFRKFVMTRLEGVAREAIVTEPQTVDDIVKQLKDGIKTESSKVIEGRILALRADKTSLTKFAEQAELLAEQFRRSLVVEGFSKEKAKELAIEKTVEMCRKSARSSSVISVLASREFKEPKEVVAKMIIEINNLKQDRPNSSYAHKHGRSNGNGHSNNRNSNGNNSNGRNGNHFQNKNKNKNNGNGNNRHNNNNNNGNRSGYQNNQRNGQNYQSNNRNFNDSRRANEQNVRVITGNETAPGNGGQSQAQEQ